MKKTLILSGGIASTAFAVAAFMVVGVLAQVVNAPAAGGRAGQVGPLNPPGKPAAFSVYVRASVVCPGLPWTILAAIGTVESGNGTSHLPGVWSGSNQLGAEGPMQFEPSTFAAYALPVPVGGAQPPSPYDLVDAAFAAARLLCADGGASPAGLRRALFAYNHSSAYVSEVISVADSYGLGAARGASEAVAYALAQVGTPYRWGGESPGIGFDCSGLAQAAWAAAGVQLPRVAGEQMAAGPSVPAGAPLEAGDLVFFGPHPGVVTHVGIVVEAVGLMVDAPHAGAVVRVENFPEIPGQMWGSDVFLGATRPGS